MSLRPLLPAFLFLFAPLAAAQQPPITLNDTGEVQCYDDEGPIACSDPALPGQDARYGRDAALVAGMLEKIGGGLASYDYTKVSNSGVDLPADAALGSGPEDWACTRDNVTGLIWEVKSDDGGLRDQDWLYTWYYTDPNDNGGDAGDAGGDTCGGTLETTCNTEAYATAINAQALCGFETWRVPTARELTSIVNYAIPALAGEGDPPMIDPDYFPNTLSQSPDFGPASVYWSVDALAQVDFAIFAWFVAFNDGAANFANKDLLASVRLVTDGSAPSRVAAGGEQPDCQFNPAIRPSTLGAFTVNGDGTVSDSRTGLMWDQCLLGQDTGNQCAGTDARFAWADGLAAVADNNAQGHLGYEDWRMPNIRELLTLVERACVYPALDHAIFPNAPGMPAVLASTSHTKEPALTWVVGFDAGGYVASFPKTLLHSVRLVRAGNGLLAFDGLDLPDPIFQDGFDPPPSGPRAKGAGDNFGGRHR